MNNTTDILILADGSEKVLSGKEKLKNLLYRLLTNDAADIEAETIGTVINEPELGFNLDSSLFSYGADKSISIDYLTNRIKNAVNLTFGSEMLIKSDDDIQIDLDSVKGILTVTVKVNGQDVSVSFS